METTLHRPARNNDFDEFLATWTKDEADEFDAALARMRRIDPADWEPFE